MTVNRTKRVKVKKETPQKDPIFHIVHSKARLPKSILNRLQEIKKRAKGKIPILVIDDREQKMKVELKPVTRCEEKIKKLRGIDLISLALEHLLTCRRKYL